MLQVVDGEDGDARRAFRRAFARLGQDRPGNGNEPAVGDVEAVSDDVKERGSEDVGVDKGATVEAEA